MPDYNKIGFKNKLIDMVQNDSIPKPTFKRFNIPLYTGRKPGTKQDSITYKKGIVQGIKKISYKEVMGELKKWRDEKWVRIGTDGSIKGACGTSKNKKNPDRCLPLAKAKSMTKAERAKTAKKKKRAGAKGKTVVANTKKGKVTKKYTKR